MKNNERAQALALLLRLFQKHQSLTHLLQAPEISPFTKTLCFGVARHYYRLTAVADHLIDKPPKDLSVWLAILLGLFQIMVLEMPDYAVVQETVALLSAKQAWAKGFVNAILRRFCREKDTVITTLADHPDFITMHPAWFVQKIQTAWPDDWQQIIHANNIHPPLSLRVNVSRRSLDAYTQDLKQAQITYQLIPHTTAGVIVTEARPVHELPGFSAGDVSVQDGAAQLAGTLLDLKPGLRVLDACCAPGGKLGQLLELEPQLQTCIGLDIDAQRLQRVQANCKRLHLQPTLLSADASQPDLWWDGQLYDRILIDAPCSATGIIRRQPDIKLLRTFADVLAITQIQTQLLHALWPLLAPGGILIYATCSIMPEENEQQIAKFLQIHPDAQVDLTPQPWGHATGHGWQILPGEQEMDGFFYAKLMKS